jgi:two-component system CheB/CheR fusion protein
LDTAKEELQSTNEELNTINEELHGRNNELGRVNSDLINLLGSVQIAIVIVGADMRIRRFTPMAERVLNLIPADVERSITHINPNIHGASLEALIAECLDTIGVIEREVRDRQGHWYALRIRPYRSADNKIDGAVLALFDIDAPKRHEASVRSATELAEAILEASSRPMGLIDSEWHLRSANTQFRRLLRLPYDGIEGKSLIEFLDVPNGRDQLQNAVSGQAESPSPSIALEIRPRHGAASVGVTARVFPAFDGRSGRLVLLTADAHGADVAESAQIGQRNRT